MSSKRFLTNQNLLNMSTLTWLSLSMVILALDYQAKTLDIKKDLRFKV